MKTYNVKLKFQEKEDEELLRETLELKRQAFNEISKIRYRMEKCNGLKGLQERCYYEIKEQFPDLPSQYIIKAIRDVVAKYKSIRKNGHIIEDPVESDKLYSTLDRHLYCRNEFQQDKIKITTIRKGRRIEVSFNFYPKLKEMFETHDLKDPSIFINEKDQMIISLVFEEKIETSLKNLEDSTAIGIDLGGRRLVATSQGMIFKGNEYKKHKRRIRHNKRKFSSRKRNSHSARTKLKKANRKERNFTKNYLHHLANEVLEQTKEADVLVLEDLTKIKKKKKKGKRNKKDNQSQQQLTRKQEKRKNNYLSQIPFYMFRIMLTYKARTLHRRVNPTILLKMIIEDYSEEYGEVVGIMLLMELFWIRT